jgi:hypothetical protein
MYRFLDCYFSLFTFLQFLLNKYHLPPTVPQTILSTLYTYTILAMALVTKYFPNQALTIIRTGIDISNAYYLGDMVSIVVYNWSNWPFLIHHSLALYLFHLGSLGIFNLYAMTNFLFYIEVSNAVLNLHLLSRYTQTSFKRLLTITYVPYRTIAVPYTAYRILQSATTPQPIATFAFSAIVIMSYVYSYVLIKRYGWYINFYLYTAVAFFYEYLPRVFYFDV